VNAIAESSLTSQIPTTIGAPFEGGFYAGTFSKGGDMFVLILSPKVQGRHDPVVWGTYGKTIEGADSFVDGLANTQAMGKANLPLSTWALGLNIDGFNDWYLPSRDELEMLYRAFKPTTDENYVYRHGDNPSSVPVGYPYTKNAPAQTTLAAFAAGGAEAFEDEWHWTSTQFSANTAWIQDFYGGGQLGAGKGGEARGVAVRRSKI
jgi:hypothetical protein